MPNTDLYDFSDAPIVLKDFLNYIRNIKNSSVNTVNGYFIDLRTFFRYVKNNNLTQKIEFNEINISDVPFEWIKNISSADVYDYLYFISNELDNSPKTRARKLSSLKAFYNYLTTKANLLDKNPCLNIELPTLKKTLPKYLSLDESLELLNNIETDFPERDYCILTLFLNCGMRLSELVSINLSGFKDNTIKIVGKGDKERLVYLNDSCLYALEQYITLRNQIPTIKDKDALFISKKLGKRLSNRRVQQIVAECLKSAGLDGKGYSPHKLRHTAATLMYRFGNVDMLALKEILGHEHVTTTEIYTHISTDQLKKAVASSPLSKVKINPAKHDGENE
jgi:Site-specific recombinase XerD